MSLYSRRRDAREMKTGDAIGLFTPSPEQPTAITPALRICTITPLYAPRHC